MFWKVCIIKEDNVIICGLDEIWTEKYCNNVQHYRLFINLWCLHLTVSLQNATFKFHLSSAREHWDLNILLSFSSARYLFGFVPFARYVRQLCCCIQENKITAHIAKQPEIQGQDLQSWTELKGGENLFTSFQRHGHCAALKVAARPLLGRARGEVVVNVEISGF